MRQIYALNAQSLALLITLMPKTGRQCPKYNSSDK